MVDEKSLVPELAEAFAILNSGKTVHSVVSLYAILDIPIEQHDAYDIISKIYYRLMNELDVVISRVVHSTQTEVSSYLFYLLLLMQC
jgi:hypothetical protein